MPIDHNLKEYAIGAFLRQGLPVKLIADICLCSEEEIEHILQDRLVDKRDYISREYLDKAFKRAGEIRSSEGAEAALFFLACAMPTGYELTEAEQNHARTLKLPQGFEPEPE